MASVMVGVLTSGFWGLIAAICLTWVFCPGFANWAADKVYYPGKKNKAPEYKLDTIRAKIMRREFTEAEAELIQILKMHPLDQAPTAVLAGMYLDNTGETDKAYALLANYLRNKETRVSGDEEFAMILVDICLDRNQPDAAREILTSELSMPHSKGSKMELQQRLASFS